MRQYVFAFVVLILCLPAFASEPGQPLDSEDWVIADPSLAGSPWAARTTDPNCMGEPAGNSARAVPPCSLGAIPDDPVFNNTLHRVGNLTDMAGNIWTWKRGSPTEPPWSCNGFSLGRIEILRCSGPATCDTVALTTERCFNNYSTDRAAIDAMWIDNANGHLYVRYRSFQHPGGGDYAEGTAVERISGLPTMFEVLQSYTPPSGPLSFTVPYMPEGFQYADWFDSYYGDLATVGDWSQARPLQCGYPATAPSRGDYLTVTDTLPDPAPGAGRYYVTSVTYQGQRRYGRKSSGGVLTGRDPAVLPECSK